MIAKTFTKRFWLDVIDNAGETGAFALDVIVKLIVAGLVGGALVSFGPLVLNAPTVLGGVFANWCAARGACDLNANLLGFGLGVYMLVVIIVMVFGAINFNPQGLDEDVLDTIRRAGAAGISAARISRLTDIQRDDVQGILANLIDENEIEPVKDSQPQLYRA